MKAKNMFNVRRPLLPLIWLITVACLWPVIANFAQGGRAPIVPLSISVPEGNKVSFHALGVGVQIYTATVSPTNPAQLVWTFREPEAVLFDDDGNIVGIHYVGPTWETQSGSKIVGARVAGYTADPSAIPWLLLRAVSTEGPGVLERTTYVQRLNTVGGIAPATPPTQLGQEARVTYVADYYFYRQATR